MTANRVIVGKFTAPHGIRGQMKLVSYTENPADIARYNLTNKSGDKTFSFKMRPATKGQWVATLKDVTTREQAELLRNVELYADRAEFDAPDEDSFFIEDLVGLRVMKEEEHYGTVLTVQNYGAGDIIEIKKASNGKKELYLFNEATFPEVDIKAQIIHFFPPEIVNAAPESSKK